MVRKSRDCESYERVSVSGCTSISVVRSVRDEKPIRNSARPLVAFREMFPGEFRRRERPSAIKHARNTRIIRIARTTRKTYIFILKKNVEFDACSVSGPVATTSYRQYVLRSVTVLCRIADVHCLRVFSTISNIRMDMNTVPRRIL